MRACNTNNCPVGIATQKEKLRKRLIVKSSSMQLKNFLEASNELMKVIARACGYDDFQKFNLSDLATSDYEMHKLTGISFAGIDQYK
jgi:glutamate synthase domain-containing protein 2